MTVYRGGGHASGGAGLAAGDPRYFARKRGLGIRGAGVGLGRQGFGAARQGDFSVRQAKRAGKRGIRSLAELLAAALASPPSRNRAQQIFRNHHIREIQPWLQKISDLAQENGSQVMLISHHPEVIDYLAASSAFRFERPTGDVVRVRPFKVNRDSGLKASEALARGWDDESTPG